MSDRLYVDLGENSYNIEFADSFDGLCAALKEIGAPKKILTVTDTNVRNLYADEVTELLRKDGYDASVYAFEAGERNKNPEAVLGICRACVENKLDRSSMIIALGGGVVGDMAGFAAAIYMRGIRFVQIPTTLLAQSDSSVGGKTGVDFENGKNLLGAFHQPGLVYINVSTLKTLPSEQFVSGMGEVIKHGIIRDGNFFDYLMNNSERIRGLDNETLIRMAKINCGIKADVVMNDERETGLRAILNFGHTIGHAIEAGCGFAKTHGECVGAGMLGAEYIAYKRGMTDRGLLTETEEILKKYGFEFCELPEKEIVWELMQKDKKKLDGTLRFILPAEKGNVVSVSDISRGEVYAAVDYLKGER